MEEFRYTDGKFRRRGYTTGSCAAAAAAAAATLLLTGTAPEQMTISLPKGDSLTIPVEQCRTETGSAFCAVKKYSGDDPDITNGTLICALVRRVDTGITIDGGTGIGRVTKPGLDQPVGNAAINSGPRAQITENILRLCQKYGYSGGMEITISAPDGQRLAKQTFNSKLGIVGGISILGTTGIVEPMSNAALVESLRTEIRVLSCRKKNMLLVLGNYGQDFAEGSLHLDTEGCIVCSNHIGDALSAAVEQHFEKILLVGHIGKLVKLGIGQTNTHSRNGDGRMETLTACALRAGADIDTLKAVLDSATTDAALNALGSFLQPTLNVLYEKIDQTLSRFVPDSTRVEWVCFTKENNEPRTLMESPGAKEFERIWRQER